MFKNRFFLAVAVWVIISGTVSESSAQRTGSTGTGTTGGSGSSGGGFSLDAFSLDGSASSNSGNSSNSNFIGGSGNTGFIGGGSAGTTGRSTTSRNSAAMRSSTSRANANTGNRMGGGTSINTQRQVQPVVTLGFAAPTLDYGRVSSLLSQRIGHTAQTGRLATVQVELAEGVAIAGGGVVSDHDKKVTENMIRLQPGVSRIQSSIQIIPSDTGQNALSPSAKRNQQPIEIPAVTTPQGRHLVHVFQHSDEIPVTTTPQGQQLVHVF
jgi:hypothetical protein